MRRTQLWFAALCSILALASCKKEGGDGRPSLDPADFDNIEAAGTVRVATRGAEPRRQLRYKFAPGQRAGMKLHMKMKSKVKLDDAEMSVNMGMRYRTDMVVQSVDGDKATVTMSFADFSMVPDETSSMLMSAMSVLDDLLESMHGTQTIDSRGRIHGMRFSGGPLQTKQAMDRMEDSIKQMSAPLPEEPVGVGARWTVYQLVNSQGIKLKQQIEFELLELDGSTAKLSTRMVQDADFQIAEMIGATGPTPTEVLEFWSRGTGTMTLDLDAFTPAAMSMDFGTKGKMSMSMGGPKMKMGMNADVHLEMTSQ